MHWFSFVYSRVTKGDKIMIPFNGHKPMTNKKIKQGFWKNAVVFFNGHMAKVTHFNGVNKFKISIHKGWIHKDLIVWN